MDEYLEEIVSTKLDELDYIESFDDYRNLSSHPDWLDDNDDVSLEDYLNQPQ